MSAEQSQPPIDESARMKISLKAGLPEELRGMILDVKVGRSGQGQQQIMVSACSWHNPTGDLRRLEDSLPQDILISHGMCQPCFEIAQRQLDEVTFPE